MLLIIDANVLIDYANTNPGILNLVVRHLGPIHVPSVILDEVEQLCIEDCESLGLTIVEESIELLTTAATERGALSFEDHVCLLLAKENNWICVSNDKPLHRACRNEKITVMWGLRLMIDLVCNGLLDKAEAMEIAKAIQVSNPRHITDQIIEDFREKITSC